MLPDVNEAKVGRQAVATIRNKGAKHPLNISGLQKKG